MSLKLQNILVVAICLLYIAASSFLVVRENYFLFLIPPAVALIYLALFRYEFFFLLIVFLTPLSVELRRFFPGTPLDLHLPTEPLIALALMMFVAKLLIKEDYDKRIFIHPLSVLIILSLIWMFITSITSSMPFISFKAFAVRFWFTGVFYFLAIFVFQRLRRIRDFLWLYILPLSLVILYALYRHSGYGFFDQKSAAWVVSPFYNDHTAYGSALAMFIPVLFVFLSPGMSRGSKQFFTGLLMVLFFTGVLFSYSRAVWLSLILTGVLWAIIYLKLSRLTIFSLAILFSVSGWFIRGEVIRHVEQTRQESSSDFTEHVRSIVNIRSDASNMERLNRWKAALEMTAEKPLTGWGPGTFMFQYAPFQKSYSRTIISTNMAEGGNVHSEYLGPLVESGIPALLLFLAIAAYAFFTGIKIYRRSQKKVIRRIALGVLMGLSTYLIHGFLNNFLETDKAAVPFWGFIAILVSIDLYYLPAENNKPVRSPNNEGIS